MSDHPGARHQASPWHLESFPVESVPIWKSGRELTCAPGFGEGKILGVQVTRSGVQIGLQGTSGHKRHFGHASQWFEVPRNSSVNFAPFQVDLEFTRGREMGERSSFIRTGMNMAKIHKHFCICLFDGCPAIVCGFHLRRFRFQKQPRPKLDFGRAMPPENRLIMQKCRVSTAISEQFLRRRREPTLKKAAESRTFFQIRSSFFEKPSHSMHAYDYAASNIRICDASHSFSCGCVEKIDMHNPLDAARDPTGDVLLDVSAFRPPPVRFHPLKPAPTVDTLVQAIHIVNNPVVCEFEPRSSQHSP